MHQTIDTLHALSISSPADIAASQSRRDVLRNQQTAWYHFRQPDDSDRALIADTTLGDSIIRIAQYVIIHRMTKAGRTNGLAGYDATLAEVTYVLSQAGIQTEQISPPPAVNSLSLIHI